MKNGFFRSKELFFSLTGICGIMYILSFSTEKVNLTKLFIWLEAEDGDEIVSPLEIIDDDDASGGKAVDNSKIPSHKVKAYIKFNPHIVTSGKYNFWARCKWSNECANTFLLKVNNSERVEFGNDPYFNEWHWVKANGLFEMQKGGNDLSVWNEEANTQIDRIMLTNDYYYVPYGLGDECNYNIDFNEGDIPFELKDKKKWQIVVLDSLLSNKALFIPSFSNPNTYESAILKVNATNEDFYISTKCRFSNNVGLLFNKTNDSYYKLNFKHGVSTFYKVIEGSEKEISRSSFKAGKSDFSDISVIRRFPETVVKCNGTVLHRIIDSSLVNGDLGVYTTTGNVFVDDFRYITELTPKFKSNFWFHKLNSSDWKRYGIWQAKHKDIQFLEGKTKVKTKPAMYIAGEHYFKDYTITCAAKLKKEAIGLCFYLQNKSNYYLLRWEDIGDGVSILKLLKVDNNNETIISQKQIEYIKGKWYRLNVSLLDSNINCYFDKRLVLSVSDKTFKEGKISFWTNARDFSGGFDDLIVEPTSDFQASLNKSRHEYKFEIRLKAALDLSDWNISSPRMLKGVSAGLQVKTQKYAFEDLYMENRMVFGSSFGIKVINSLPREVDEYIKITELGNNTEYKFLFRHSKFVIFKNNLPLLEKSIKSERNQIKVTCADGKWKTYLNGQEYFAFRDVIESDSVKLGVGYSGPGKGSITINKLLIENPDNK